MATHAGKLASLPGQVEPDVVPDASLKLRALCEGLEIQHLDKLLELGQIGDFRRLGKRMAERIREIKHNTSISG